MSQSDSPSQSRFKSLPMWFRVVLAATPPLVCGLLICAVGAYLLQPQLQSTGTPTGEAQLTQLALTAARLHGVEGAAGSATAAAATVGAGNSASATALVAGRLEALTQQFLTQAAVPTGTARPTFTPAPTFSGATLVPSITPTRSDFVTLTLLECRGYDGTVVFDQDAGQSLHAHGSLSYSVRGGTTHHLQIFWTNHPDQNVDNVLDMQRDTTLVFGDQC
jgi:hypothetical protein